MGEMSIQVCANCGKPYDEHLLWDGNKCEPGSIAGWFPKQVADAIESAKTSPKQSKIERDYAQMYNALKRICAYQTPDQMRRGSSKQWGLDDAEECIGYAYENIQSEAKAGLKGVRKPTSVAARTQEPTA